MNTIVSNDWTDAERLRVIAAIAKRMSEQQIHYIDGLFAIRDVAERSGMFLQDSRVAILFWAGLEEVEGSPQQFQP